jgi:hypothetical protein
MQEREEFYVTTIKLINYNHSLLALCMVSQFFISQIL